MSDSSGRFIVDRFGRRLLDDQGRFMVHDSTAAPCCTGCPWGVSIEGPDHPGGPWYPNTPVYTIVDITQHWNNSPLVGGVWLNDTCYMRFEGMIGPATFLALRARVNNTLYPDNLLFRGKAYIDSIINPYPPGETDVTEMNTPHYPYIADCTVRLFDNFNTTLGDYLYLVAGTQGRSPGIFQQTLPQSGMIATITRCILASEYPHGITPEVQLPFILSGVGQRYYPGGLFGDPPPLLCDGYPGVYHDSNNDFYWTHYFRLGWPIYKHIYTDNSSGYTRVRISAHGINTAYGYTTTQWAIRTHHSRGGGDYRSQSFTIPQSNISCGFVEWDGTVEIDIGHETPGYLPAGHFAMIDLICKLVGDRVPAWCVIDAIEIL